MATAITLGEGAAALAGGKGAGTAAIGQAENAALKTAAKEGAALNRFGSGRPPHAAEVTVIRDGHVVSQARLTSGQMTAEEAALRFPRSTLATHTESRAVRSTPLQAGDTMIIQGTYPPCTPCKGAMNKVASESGATIQYQWEGNIWIANGGRK